jgi:outer membrane protein OmpA-like peptidoglycan-associated protein
VIKRKEVAMKVKNSILAVIFTLCFLPFPALAGECERAVELYNKGTQSKDLIQKEALFEEALTLSCKDKELLAKIHNNLADAYEQQGRIKEAISGYKKAIELDRELATPYLSLGDIYFGKGIYEYSIEYYERGLTCKEDSLARSKLEEARKQIPFYRSKKDIVSSLSLKSPTRAIRPVPSVNLYFGFDSAKITEKGGNQLSALLDALGDRELESYRFRFTGHTCDLGAEEYNQELSEQRAKAVRDWLIGHGHMKGQIDTTGYGETKPLDPRNTEEARKLNRRVEVRTVGLTVVTKRSANPEIARGIGLSREGERLLNESRPSEAGQMFEEALRIFKEHGFREGILSVTANLYLVHVELGERDEATRYLDEFQRYSQ